MYSSKDYLSIRYLNKTYNGGAHGESAYLSQTYDLKTGKLLLLSDLMKNNGYTTVINQAIVVELKARGDSSITMVDIKNSQPYYLTNNAIVVYYPPYTHYIPADRDKECFTINYSTISPYMKYNLNSNLNRQNSTTIQSTKPLSLIIKETKKSPIEVGWGDAPNNELWLKYTDGHDELLVTCRANTDLKKQIAGISNPQISLDKKRIYFESAAYVTSNTVFIVDIETKKVKFICAGNEVKVITTGEYAGKISVYKHEYADGGGSFDRGYIIDDDGNVLKQLD